MMEDSSRSSDAFVERLQYVLGFLSEHGFDRAATAVYEQLEAKVEPPGEADAVEPSQPVPEYGPDETEHAHEYRSVSADPVLQGR
jgi:hypothetical protein